MELRDLEVSNAGRKLIERCSQVVFGVVRNGSLVRGLTKGEKQSPSMFRFGCMAYQCEATNLPGLIQYLASNVLAEGYWWYVQDRIPAGKDPRAVDAKLVERYGLDITASARARRKQAGLANVRYLRFGRDFILLATKGQHPFYGHESKLDATGHEVRIKNAQRVAVKFGGYSLRVVRGGYLRKLDTDAVPVKDGKLRVRVAIGRERYLDLKAHFLELATRLPAEELARAFYAIPFEPFAPVVVQVRNLLRWVNKARHAAGLDRVPMSVIRTKRALQSPFEPVPDELAA